MATQGRGGEWLLTRGVGTGGRQDSKAIALQPNLKVYFLSPKVQPSHKPVQIMRSSLCTLPSHPRLVYLGAPGDDERATEFVHCQTVLMVRPWQP